MDNNKVIVPDTTKGGKSSINPSFPAALNKEIVKKNADLLHAQIDAEDKKSERGVLGKFFGAGVHSSKNIVGLLIILLLIIGVGYTLYMLHFNPESTHSQVLDFWGIISPLITLSLGYLFGKGAS